MNDFITKQEAAAILRVSPATVRRRAVPWRDTPLPYRIRVKVDALERPFFYRPDVEAKYPPPATVEKQKPGRRRKLFSRRSPSPGGEGWGEGEPNTRQTTLQIH